MKSKIFLLTLISLVILAENSFAKCIPPTWVKSKTIINGQDERSKITVFCSGSGSTQEIAEIEAKNSCDTTAANQFHSSIDVKDTAIVQDHDSAFNREVGVKSCVIGLICEEPNVSTCSDNNETYVWRKCTYDLSKAREGSDQECVLQGGNTQRNISDAIANRESLSRIKKKVDVKNVGKFERGKSYILNISSVPKCDDIMVSGAKPRVVKCSLNPQPISVRSDDREIIIRSTGYLPKTIELNATGNESQVNVFLDVAD